VDSGEVTIAVNFWWKSNIMSSMVEHMDAYYLRRVLNRHVKSLIIEPTKFQPFHPSQAQNIISWQYSDCIFLITQIAYVSGRAHLALNPFPEYLLNQDFRKYSEFLLKAFSNHVYVSSV